jgi:hypothetical protein
MDSENKKKHEDDSSVNSGSDPIVGTHSTEGTVKVRVNTTTVEVPASIARAARRVGAITKSGRSRVHLSACI